MTTEIYNYFKAHDSDRIPLENGRLNLIKNFPAAFTRTFGKREYNKILNHGSVDIINVFFALDEILLLCHGLSEQQIQNINDVAGKILRHS